MPQILCHNQWDSLNPQNFVMINGAPKNPLSFVLILGGAEPLILCLINGTVSPEFVVTF